MCGITPPPAMVAWQWQRQQLRPAPRARPPFSHLDQRVQLLVTADGELQVARRDALHLE